MELLFQAPLSLLFTSFFFLSKGFPFWCITRHCPLLWNRAREVEREKRKAKVFYPVIKNTSFSGWKESFHPFLTGFYKLLLPVWDFWGARIQMKGQKGSSNNDIFFLLGSFCISLLHITYFWVFSLIDFRLRDARGRKIMVNSAHIWWYLRFWCTSPNSLLLFCLQSPQTAEPSILYKFYSCFHWGRKESICLFHLFWNLNHQMIVLKFGLKKFLGFKFQTWY